MKKEHLEALADLTKEYPASVVVRCLADQFMVLAELAGEQPARKLRHLANSLFKAANLHKYL